MNTTTTTTSTGTGTIEHVDPSTITVEANVRSEAALGRDFVASVKANGVLTPILAHRTKEGAIVVRAGQRRTLAAREAGLATIPAYITDADEDTVQRIVQQMAENEHREAVTDTDRVAAYQQLALEGLTAAVIAKRLHTKPSAVKAGLAVADSGVASTALAAHSLTLDQAATLIEFEGDTDTVAALIETAESDPGQFAHTAQRARDERHREQVRVHAAAPLLAAGFKILDYARGYGDTDYTNIRELVTSAGEPVTVELLEQVEGRAAFVKVYYSDSTASVSYFLKDPKAAGFRRSNGSGAASGPMTDEQKVERKTLIANNKAWGSAEIVRREWLVEFLTRKTLPKDAAVAIAQGLATHSRAVGTAVTGGNVLAHTLLGIERANSWEGGKLAAVVEHSPAKAQHVSLAVVLAGIEDSTSKETWRYPHTEYALYFEQLAAWGYALSDVEQIVVTAAAKKATEKKATEK
ncbi:MAG: ParB/RepB/Spo0J family partition protein [Rhodoglobus sp.]